MNYDVNYFIRKFEAIPDKRWITGDWDNTQGCCANGHCDVSGGKETLEAICLNELFSKLTISIKPISHIDLNEDCWYSRTVAVNDGFTNEYPQPTPKQRILAALYDIKKMQEEQKVEPAPKVIHVYHAIEVDKSLSEQSKELITEN